MSHPSKVAIAGGSGFLGRALTTALGQKGITVQVLARHLPTGSAGRPVDLLTAPASVLEEAMAGADRLVLLAGVLRAKDPTLYTRLHVEATGRLLTAAAAVGVEQAIYLSAAGADVNGPTPYLRSKAEAERTVQTLAPAHAILRPAVVMGPGGFLTQTAPQLRLPVVPVPGGNRYAMRPVLLETVITTLVHILTQSARTFPACDVMGPEAIGLMDLFGRIATALSRHPLLIPMPLALVRMGLPVMGLLPNPPVTADELRMLTMGAAGDPGALSRVYGLTAAPVTVEALRQAAAEAGLV